ncbi:PDZ domain-containing protein [Salibacterium aidingense]|uniref:PDZ domain-containing protein n=1 Tax=Salibacterium aidingense TaxID=384933 RepID=UPI003BDF9936
MSDIGWELLQGFGRFFVHPLTYVIPVAMFVLGILRVKKERASFHTRMFRAAFDVTAPLLPGLAAGALLSIIVAVTGMAVPLVFIGLVSLLVFLILLTGRIQWLSPAFTVSAAIILALFLPIWETGNQMVDSWFQVLEEMNYQPVLIWLAAFIVLEGLLVLRNGKQNTSPVIVKSTRGKWVGAHRLRRIWLVPSVMFVPEGMIDPVSWWPLLSAGEGGLALFILPLAVGADYSIFHTLPAPAVKRTGLRIIMLGLAAGVGAAVSFYYPEAVLYTAVIVFVLREALIVWRDTEESSRPAFFRPRSHGLLILAVLPESPAAKMGLAPGETIMKVNGLPVHTEREFYKGLQKNSAYCKVEVLDINGELRHVQSAVYDNEHHEIGVLTVKEKEEYPVSGVQL